MIELQYFGSGVKLFEVRREDYIVDELHTWCSNSDECSGFESLWKRFHNWENSSAFVYVLLKGVKEKVVGINAFTCNIRNPYVNCYYFEIDPSIRRRGFGKKLFFSCIIKGKERLNRRLTLRTKQNSIGLNFYKIIGMRPRYYDTKSREYIFDLSIQDVNSIDDIRRLSEKLHDPPSFSRMRLYKNYEEI